MARKFKRVKVTAHDSYIGIEWETDEEKGLYEFEKIGSGWKAYSSTITRGRATNSSRKMK